MEAFMHFPICFLQISILILMGLMLGCSDRPTGMRNMQPGTASIEQKDPPPKKDNKPNMPVDPPAPEAPPR
jgi:hypothetical protein